MKWTLVTGGAKRLGAEICRALAQKGHSIVIQYNTSKKEAEALAEECRGYNVAVECLQGSFSSLESTLEFIQRYKERFPHTENLINNVGKYLVKKAVNTSPEDFYELFQLNVHAPHLLSLKIVEDGGSIINIGTSGVLSFRANTLCPVYTASKSALWSLTKSLAKEFIPRGIRVNMVSPGILENSIDAPSDASHLLMKRLGTLHEVACMVTHLLEKESSYITGQNIEVAGGIGL